MNDNPIKKMLADAQAMDLNRQRQIEAQKAVINRLLEARESEADDKSLIHDLCDERRQLEEQKLDLQAKLDNVALVVKDWAKYGGEEARDRIVEALAGRPS